VCVRVCVCGEMGCCWVMACAVLLGYDVLYSTPLCGSAGNGACGYRPLSRSDHKPCRATFEVQLESEVEMEEDDAGVSE